MAAKPKTKTSAARAKATRKTSAKVAARRKTPTRKR